MDEKYGDSWHDMKEKMSELSEDLSERVQDNPTFKDVEALYFRALVEENKMDSYAAKQYESKLKNKQAKSSTKPASPGESTPSVIKNMMDAYSLAKQQQE